MKSPCIYLEKKIASRKRKTCRKRPFRCDQLHAIQQQQYKAIKESQKHWLPQELFNTFSANDIAFERLLPIHYDETAHRSHPHASVQTISSNGGNVEPMVTQHGNIELDFSHSTSGQKILRHSDGGSPKCPALSNPSCPPFTSILHPRLPPTLHPKEIFAPRSPYLPHPPPPINDISSPPAPLASDSAPFSQPKKKALSSKLLYHPVKSPQHHPLRQAPLPTAKRRTIHPTTNIHPRYQALSTLITATTWISFPPTTWALQR